MASSLTKVEKKLNQLLTQKAKEEAKYAEAFNKLTTKYQADTKKIKDTYDEKRDELKSNLNDKLKTITPEIEFYTKQKQNIERLEAQLRNIEMETDERLNGDTKKDEQLEEIVENPVAEDSEKIYEPIETDELDILSDDGDYIAENESEDDNFVELESEEEPEENSASQRGGYRFW